jgi:hypothetical protein
MWSSNYDFTLAFFSLTVKYYRQQQAANLIWMKPGHSKITTSYVISLLADQNS